ncbi:MAG TPA: Fic family protein, partial [Vulgatibacter sp.]
GETAEWCGMFAAAARTAAAMAKDLAGRIASLQDAWRLRSQPRRGSTADALIDLLPAHPILSLASARQITGRSKQATNVALAALEEAGVLRRLSIGKRNRAWEAREVFDLANGFEQELGLGPRAGR